jgi:hypothetical protein
MFSTLAASALPAVANGLQLRFVTFCGELADELPHMARPVGLRGGCGVIGVGASRGRMAAVQPGRELWQRTQIDLRTRRTAQAAGWPIASLALATALATGPRRAFRAAWERLLSREKADEKCST